jgi:predicted amidophosphoribosyltransferase
MFCSKCGAKNDDNAKFCFQCGNRFDEAGVIKPQQPQAPAGGATYNQPQGAPFTQVPYQ